MNAAANGRLPNRGITNVRAASRKVNIRLYSIHYANPCELALIPNRSAVCDGADFSFQVAIESEIFTKEPSVIEQKAYRDTWGRGVAGYLQWFYDSSLILYELLSTNGSIYVHIDSNISHFVKNILDEVFSPTTYKNEIIWKRTSSHANVSQQYGNVHNVILFYTKSDKYTWNQQHTPYSDEYINMFFDQTDERGKRYARRDLTASMERASASQIYPWKGITPPLLLPRQAR